jgi:hypothetical protein
MIGAFNIDSLRHALALQVADQDGSDKIQELNAKMR